MKLVTGALLVLTIGCAPDVGIEVTGTKNKLTFAFKNCRDGSKFGINHVSVIDKPASSPTEAAHEVCELRPPAGPVASLTEWEYGTRASGYALLNCQELRVGQIYTVSVSKPYGARRFRLLDDHTVSTLDPACLR